MITAIGDGGSTPDLFPHIPWFMSTSSWSPVFSVLLDFLKRPKWGTSWELSPLLSPCLTFSSKAHHYSLNSSTLATSCEELTHWKILWCWEGLGPGGEGDDRGWDGWMASLTRWTWVWVNSGSWWWTRRPGVLRFMGSQTDTTEQLNWTERCNSWQVISPLWVLFLSCFNGSNCVWKLWCRGNGIMQSKSLDQCLIFIADTR